MPARTSSEELEAALRASLFDAPSNVGPLHSMATAAFDSGGKRLRARLALVAAELWSVPDEAARLWAVACEVLHNGTLVHDDLQDGDTLRRGAPTLWVRFGAAQAINVGDWLLMRALAAAARAGGENAKLACQLTATLRQALETVIAGQAEECSWRIEPTLTWPAYSRCVRAKTAALFALPIEGAALLAGRSAAEAAQLAAPFVPIGELFQLADDVIDLYGDKGRAAPGQDLYEGKVSALVVAHVLSEPGDQEALLRLLQTPRASTDVAEVERARAAFVTSGALSATQARIADLAREARALSSGELKPVVAHLLRDIEAPLATLVLPAVAADESQCLRHRVAQSA